MGRPRTWTDEQLREAVAASQTLKMVKERLGLKGTGDVHYDLKARIAQLKLDVSHFTRAVGSATSWSERELRVAMEGAPNLAAVLDRLGVTQQSKHFKRLRRRIVELGLKSEFTGYTRKPRRWSDDELRLAVASSHGYASTLRQLGLVPAGGNYDLLKKRIRELRLDTSHFLGTRWSAGKAVSYRAPLPLDQLLVKGRLTSSQQLKMRLLREGLRQPRCELCGWAEVSMDGRLPIELDHINGDKLDNRIENLRILCPNCHSLQPTHRGSNHRYRKHRV
jgi:hypothetical protein